MKKLIIASILTSSLLSGCNAGGVPESNKYSFIDASFRPSSLQLKIGETKTTRFTVYRVIVEKGFQNTPVQDRNYINRIIHFYPDTSNLVNMPTVCMLDENSSCEINITGENPGNLFVKTSIGLASALPLSVQNNDQFVESYTE